MESEVLGFLPCGLEARPGPTDLLNCGKDGVWGVWFVEFWVPALRPCEGVIGNELVAEVGESRLTALFRGKKMPAPGILVPK